ncbi:hypothetical protein ACLB2K_021417 [Fragaria x ananassa]
MSKKEEEEVVFDLLEDVVVKILCRLPVKSLLRLTCVSKRRHSIISDSKFARSTFEVVSQTRTLRPRLLFSTYPYHRSWDPRFEYERSIFECFGDTDISCLERNPLCQSLTPPPGVCIERVLASCNGLVVLGKTLSDSYTNLSVWNPSTGFFRKIPSPEFRDSSWKDIRFPHSSFPCGDDGKVLLVSNGAIHWVSTGIPEAISAFDLVSEEFRQLPLPRGLNGRRIWTQFSVVDLPNVFGLVDGWVPAFVTEGSTVVMLHGKELARIKCHREGKPRTTLVFLSISMSKKARVVVFDLPEDVVVNILCRLPVKSLIRFTCVSKRWRSIIISDSQFATSTFQLASQTTTLRQRLLLSCDRDYIPCRFQCIGDLDMPCFGGSSLVQSLTLPPEVKTERMYVSHLVEIGPAFQLFFGWDTCCFFLMSAQHGFSVWSQYGPSVPAWLLCLSQHGFSV